ncbi:MAG: major facilitator transporter [Candidatus Aramenus sulfurataquae]|uniref:Major facilitator transporter n=1 Tax=Candidatus Aramenus sulfurataquae TaxID=1326980 RepID=W7KKV5_9CREN|nr:MAG: major facilitator transporter [Candidatus Aramenus sulfurataquae]
MKQYIHATIASTIAWAGNIYDLLLLTYVYPELMRAFSLNYLLISVLFALGLIGRVIGGFAFGKYADSIGRKPVLLLGTGGYAAFQGVLAFSPNALLLFASRFLEGVFMGAQWTAGTVIAYEQAPQSMKGVVTGIVQTGYGIGYALTGVTYLAFLPTIEESWRYFLLVGSLPLLVVPYAHLKVKESKVTSTGTAKVKYKDYLPVLIRATAGMSGMFVAYFCFFGNYETVEEKFFGISPSTVGEILTVANVVLALSFLLFGRLADYVGKSRLIYAGLVTLTVSTPFAIPLFLPHDSLSVLIGTSVYSFSDGFWPLMPLLIAEAVPMEVRGALAGLSYNIGGLVGGLADVALGVVDSLYGLSALVNAMFALQFVAILVVFVSVITWPKSGTRVA